MASFRIKRLEKELFKIVSNTINLKLRDKRLSCVTITSIRLTNDMSVARIYFTQYDTISNAVVQDTLQRSSGAIKKEIAAAKLMRSIPELRFRYDELEENARNLDDIFAQIRQESLENSPEEFLEEALEEDVVENIQENSLETKDNISEESKED